MDDTITVNRRERIRVLAAFRKASVDGGTRSNPAQAVLEGDQWRIVLANGQQFTTPMSYFDFAELKSAN